MVTYIQNRLVEHSTQVALAADLAAFFSAVNGTMTWPSFYATLAGSLVAIVFPSRSAP